MDRCRVTFFDVQHCLKRTVEVESASPMAAAEAGLKWMLAQDFFVEDFAANVEIEVITTARHALPLTVIAQRIEPAKQKKVA